MHAKNNKKCGTQRIETALPSNYHHSQICCAGGITARVPHKSERLWGINACTATRVKFTAKATPKCEPKSVTTDAE